MNENIIIEILLKVYREIDNFFVIDDNGEILAYASNDLLKQSQT